MPIPPPCHDHNGAAFNKSSMPRAIKGHARRLMAILLLHEGRTITDVQRARPSVVGFGGIEMKA